MRGCALWLLVLGTGGLAAWHFGPGLWDRLVAWLPGQYDQWISAHLPRQYSTVLLSPRSRMAPLYVLLVAACFGLMLFARSQRGRRSARSSKREDNEDDIKRPTNTPLFELDLDLGALRHMQRPEPELGGRLIWRMRPPADYMEVDGLYLPRTGKRSHGAWLGPTGSGKSASVATVRVNGMRPTLIATPDVSDPLIEATQRLGGFIWIACESRMPVNFLIGPPTEVAERLTEVFRSGGNGAWKRTTRRAAAMLIRQMDDEGEPRSLVAIGRKLEAYCAKDRELKMIISGWVERFLDLADQFGDSIGEGGVDIAELLQAGKTVYLGNDAFAHRSLGGDVVALGLAEGLRIAPLLPNGYRLIFEEAGQLGERIDLAEPFHRAGRRRKVALDDLTQAESDLIFDGNDGITANLGVRVYFNQEIKPLQKLAGDRLGLKTSELDPAKMADYTAWIASGRVRRLVHFPKPAKAPKSENERSFDPSGGAGGEGRGPGVIRIEEVFPPGRGAGAGGAGTSESVDDVLALPVYRINGSVPLPAAPGVAMPEYVACLEHAERVPGAQCKRCRREEIYSRCVWTAGGCLLWPEDAGRNKAYGKTSYLNKSGWETHFLFWAWKVMEDHAAGRKTDLDVFAERHPEVSAFRWPESDSELVVLLELKTWMAQPFGVDPRSFGKDDPRHMVKLSIDHRCPASPNPLCQNADRDLWLVTGGENSAWRHARRTGKGRLAVEAMYETDAV